MITLDGEHFVILPGDWKRDSRKRSLQHLPPCIDPFKPPRVCFPFNQFPFDGCRVVLALLILCSIEAPVPANKRWAKAHETGAIKQNGSKHAAHTTTINGISVQLTSSRLKCCIKRLLKQKDTCGFRVLACNSLQKLYDNYWAFSISTRGALFSRQKRQSCFLDPYSNTMESNLKETSAVIETRHC